MKLFPVGWVRRLAASGATVLLAAAVLPASACGGATEAAEPATARSGPTVRPARTGTATAAATVTSTRTTTATATTTPAPARTATATATPVAATTAASAPATAASPTAEPGVARTRTPDGGAGGGTSGPGGNPGGAAPTAAPRASVPADTPAGSLLGLGQGWTQSGITLALVAIKVDQTDVDGVRLAFTMTNSVSNQVLFQAPVTVIAAVDDAGRTYSADAAEPPYSFPVEPGQTVRIPRDVRRCCTSELSLSVAGDPRDATTLTVSVQGLGPIAGARWSVPIPR